ncbi:hypothetical protein [Streptomyces sp. NPDC051109]|uniref:hypothetical protein n=1 Tax=Streptomyces sp. NPDC051109 TaxID=3365642 RepID=UPI0037B1EBB1
MCARCKVTGDRDAVGFGYVSDLYPEKPADRRPHRFLYGQLQAQAQAQAQALAP